MNLIHKNRLNKTNLYSLCLWIVLFSAAPIFANPMGGQIAAGNVSIKNNANTTIIKQSSQKAILNWESFNIGKKETTRFIQPRNGIALNRISPTQGASQIFGTLKANGQIILINPAGIFFSSGAYVNVGSLIASTAGISDANFLKGIYKFDQASMYPNASIVNQGTIIAQKNGLVALVGQNVRNDGTIQANLGNIILAGANTFTMSFDDSGLINFSIGAADKSNSVTNTGKLIADGGKILVTAKAASGVLDNVINMQGIAQAKSIGVHNGEIIISGNNKVNVSGKVIATGRRAKERGGVVKILGDDIKLAENAFIDVSGALGGGEVLVGGNAHGVGPEPNAKTVYMDSNAKIFADALTQGDGGTVVLWSDVDTQFFGTINARGGKFGGNGGWVETSGGYLDARGMVNTSASNGYFGTWLLDPANIIISIGADANYTNIGNTFTPDSSAANSTINTTTLSTALASNNIIVTTTNNGASGGSAGTITVSDPISWASSASLTLTAASTIAINAAITIGNASTAQLILNAVGNVTQTALIGGLGGLTQSGAGMVTLSLANTYSGGTTINSGTLATANINNIGSGGLTIDGGIFSYTGNNASLTNAITIGASGGTIQATNAAARTLTLTGGITNSGALTFDTTGAGPSNIIVSTNGLTGSGGVTKTGTGTLTFGVANSYTGATNINAGTVTLTNASGLGSDATQSSSTTVASGSRLNLNFATATLGNTNNISLDGTGVGGVGALTASTSTETLSNNITLAGSTTIGGASNMVLNGVIDDGGNAFVLTKVGAGTTTLAGANTYSGGTTINTGTLIITNQNGLGTAGAIAVNNAAILRLNLGGNTLQNASSITLSGTADLTGANAASTTDTLNNPISLIGSDHTITSTTNNAILALTGNIDNSTSNLSFAGTGDTEVSGVIGSGSGNLSKSGGGTLTLRGANTYTGTTSLSAGLLSVLNSNGLGGALGGTISITGGTLSFNLGGASLANSSAISISGGSIGVTDTAAAGVTDTLNNAISTTATTTTITSTNATALFSLTGGIANNGTTLTFTGAGDHVESGALTGSSIVRKAGNGTLTLSGSNSYTGATNVTDGTLSVTNTQGLGGATGGIISVSSGSILALDLSGGTLANSNTLNLTAAATLRDDTAAGNTDTLNNPITLTTSTPTITTTNAGAALHLTGNITNSTGTLTINGAGDTTLSGALGSSTGGLTKSDTGTLTLNAANTYTGTTTINAGTLKLGINNAISSGSAVVLANVAGALLDLNSFNDVIGSLATGGALGGNVNLGSGTLTTGGNNTNTTYNGVISGSGGLIKMGTGTMTLGGANTFTGATAINAGILSLSAANSLGSGANQSSSITVASDAALDLTFPTATLGNTNNISLIGTGPSGAGALTASQNTETLDNAITFTGNTTIGGANNMILNGIINDGGNGFVFTKAGNGTLTLAGANTYTGGTIINGGTLNVRNTAALGTMGAINVNNAATLNFNLSGDTLQNSSTLTLSGTADITGANAANTTDTLNNPINLTGTAHTITSTTNNAILVINGNINNGTASLTFAGAGDTDVSGVIGNGSGTLSKSGSGTLILRGANTYTGTTSLSAGVLSVLNSHGFGDATGGAISITGGTLSLNLGGTNLANTSAIGLSGGSVGITDIAAAGLTDTLNNVISTTATTTTFTSTNANALFNLTGGVANNGTTLIFTGAGDLAESDVLAGSGIVQKSGNGTLTLSGSNSYTGATNVTDGTLSVTNTHGLGGATGGEISVASGSILALDLGGGTLANSNTLHLTAAATLRDDTAAGNTDTLNNPITLTTSTPTITTTNAGALLHLTGDITNSTGTLTINGAGDTTLSGVFGSSTGGITKAGTGTLTLSAANTYSGATTINAGTLNLMNASGLGSDAAVATINAGATLQINNVAVGNKPITINNGGTLLGIGTAALSGNITLGNAGANRTIATNNAADSFTLNGTINGPRALTLSGPGTLVLNGNIGDTTALVSITNDSANTIIYSSTITTTGAQIYNNPVVIGADAVFTAQNFTVANGVSGNQNLTLIGDTGTNNFSLTGTISLNSLSVLGSANGNNTLAVNSGNFEIWNITSANAGTIAGTGANSFTFSSIDNLTGGNNGNTFSFGDGASVSGQIDGGSLDSANTLDYSAYSSPITVLLGSLFYSGTTENNLGVDITDFININNLIGNALGNSTLRLASDFATLTFNSANSGFIEDPLNFGQFNRFATLNNNDAVVFNAHGVYNIATNQLVINGTPVEMTGFNYHNFSGNIIFINPVPPVPPLPPVPNTTHIAQILSPFGNLPVFEVNADIAISITNEISAGTRYNNLRFAGKELSRGILFNSKMIENLFFKAMPDTYSLRNFVLNNDAPKILLGYLFLLGILLGLLNNLKKFNAQKKKSYIPTISFELRESFNSIIGFSALMYSENLGYVPHAQKTLLQDVLSASKNLLTYISQFEEININSNETLKKDLLFKLRTDLNTVIGFVTLIKDGDIGEISPQQKVCLEDVLYESKNALVLAESVK